jgi:hypothetical protein
MPIVTTRAAAAPNEILAMSALLNAHSRHRQARRVRPYGYEIPN